MIDFIKFEHVSSKGYGRNLWFFRHLFSDVLFADQMYRYVNICLVFNSNGYIIFWHVDNHFFGHIAKASHRVFRQQTCVSESRKCSDLVCTGKLLN